MHYLSCSDPVLRRLNRTSWNMVISTIRKLRTTQVISAAFYNILEALMRDETPRPPTFPETTIGGIAKQAWKEQEALGWINVAKGRLCKKWGEAQGEFYRLHPELRLRKWCSSFTWTKKMMAALLTMSLQMWKDRCECLHGRTGKEKNGKAEEPT